MKAVTIKNPWGWLIAKGIKDIENRTWKTNYRGKIHIHAGAQWDHRHVAMNLLFTKPQWDVIVENNLQVIMAHATLPKSAIIGEVDIVDCVIGHPSVWAEKAAADAPPIYNWVLANPIYYDKEPILNVKGALGIWNIK